MPRQKRSRGCLQPDVITADKENGGKMIELSASMHDTPVKTKALLHQGSKRGAANASPAQCQEPSLQAVPAPAKRAKTASKASQRVAASAVVPKQPAATSSQSTEVLASESKATKKKPASKKEEELEAQQLQQLLELEKEYQVEAGKERWRQYGDLAARVNSQPDLSHSAIAALNRVSQQFSVAFGEAAPLEKQRCEKLAESRRKRALGTFLLKQDTLALTPAERQRLQQLSQDPCKKQASREKKQQLSMAEDAAATGTQKGKKGSGRSSAAGAAATKHESASESNKLQTDTTERELLSPEELQEMNELLAKCFADAAMASQRETLEKHAAKLAKNVTQRPDTKAMSSMQKANPELTKESNLCFGCVPGTEMGRIFHSRAEMVVTRQHRMPMAGISTLPTCKGALANAIAVSGGYPENERNVQEFWYQGEGGNDTLGDKGMTGNQELQRGNLALVRNIYLQVPVRVYFKTEHEESPLGTMFQYAGCFSVTAYKSELVDSGNKHNKGKQFRVYKFKLVRMPDQEPLPAELTPPEFRLAGRKTLEPQNMHNLVTLDITLGKAEHKIPAVNALDLEIPPCCTLESLVKHEQLKGVAPSKAVTSCKKDWQPSLEYITEHSYTAGVARPEPATLEQLASLGGNMAQLVSEVQCGIKEPHDIIRALNNGRLPYVEIDSRPNAVQHGSLLRDLAPVVYECGDWTGCKDSCCSQRRAQQPSNIPLCLVRYPDRGWGVVATRPIRAFSFICAYYGEVKLIKDHVNSGDDDTYCFDIGKRSDMTWDGRRLEEDEEDPDPQEATYCVDSLHKGNVARFVNHDCNPNAFIQPVLINTLDKAHPTPCLFAFSNISAWQEITLDYSNTQLKDEQGQCRCTSCQKDRKNAQLLAGHAAE